MIMMITIGFALAVAAAVIWWGSKTSRTASRIFDGIAWISFFVFFVIAASAVIETIADGTVFMTEVHHVFLNPLLLASGAYLGPYTLSRVAMLSTHPV